MKKRGFALLLIVSMLLTLLPVTASAAGTGAMDTIPAKFDVEIDLTKTNGDINIKDSRTYYIYASGYSETTTDWVWTKKIQIKNKLIGTVAPHIFLDGVNIQIDGSGRTPAIELHGKASAYLYFINKDSKLTGGGGRAAIQKNRSEGQLCVQVMKGTTVTCQGGFSGAGIGGSYANRYVGSSWYNIDMYGHGVNMHFGSQTNPDLWSGTIIARGGKYSAGIGGGREGSGEKLYFYSGRIEATGGEMGAGIGGSFKGRGSDIYIYGGDISATGGIGSPGIGAGCWMEEQDMDSANAARNINIYGGKVYACGGENGAGIGGGQYVPAHDITITGGEVTAHGIYGAAIGGGRWCHGQNITATNATLHLTTGRNKSGSDAAVMGYGDLAYPSWEFDDFIKNPSMERDYKSIKIGSTTGKLVQLKLEAQGLNRNDQLSSFWNLYDILIPNENGRIDVQLLTLPYVQNYGWAIYAMELTLIDDPCRGNHDFGWVDRQSCHVWACRNMKCQARDPAAEQSKRNGKHASSGWNTETHQLVCDFCGHVMETDTKAPVLEVLEDGKIYTAEDTLQGTPGAYTFTVSDPAKNRETSSGIKSVTINGAEQTVGSTYQLPAPDGGNNDAGNKYTVIATDNAGNTTAATVSVYRRHKVTVVDKRDESKKYAEMELPHNEYLVITMKMPERAAAKLTDKATGEEIPYDQGKGQFPVGPITKSRTFLLEYSTDYPKVELRLGTSQYFTGYNAEPGEACYAYGISKNKSSLGDYYYYMTIISVETDAEPGYYFSSPTRYTKEELEELPDSAWSKYEIPTGSIISFIGASITVEEYEKAGSWYIYAKAENAKGTTYVSTPNLIVDVDKPRAINISTGEELVERNGKYWGDLKFRIDDATPVTVRYFTSPGGAAVLMTPDENGIYTIPADYSGSIQHTLTIEDACGNRTSYGGFKVSWNYLTAVEWRDHWEEARTLRISKGQDLAGELEKLDIVVKSAGIYKTWKSVDVVWEIPKDYNPQSPREQTFTVNGTVVLEGTGDAGTLLPDIVTRPGEEWKKNISFQVTVEGEPQYTVQIDANTNGSVTVANAQQTDQYGRALFYEGEQVMLSVVPAGRYELATLSVLDQSKGILVDCEGEDGTYSFTQPRGPVTIYAGFKRLTANKPNIRVTGEYVYTGEEQAASVVGFDARTMDITGHTGTDVGEYTVCVTPNAALGTWSDGTADAVTAQWRIEKAKPDAPTGLTGVAPTEKDGSDGKITGTDTNMEYRVKGTGGEHYTACAGPEITGLSAGTYEVRYRGTKNYDPSEPAEVVVEKNDTPDPPAKYSITFSETVGGTASAAPNPAAAGETITLTAAPGEGYRFKQWQVVKPEGITITENRFTMPAGEVEIKAVFEENHDTKYNILIRSTEGGTAAADRTSAAAGATITLTATPNEGYRFKQWQVVKPEGLTITENQFTMPAGEVEIKAVFEENHDTKYDILIRSTEGGTAAADRASAAAGEIIILTATPNEGYHFKQWQVVKPEVLTITENRFTMPAGSVEIQALFEEDTPEPTTCTVTFAANGGSGTMEPATVEAGSRYLLPACTFTAPEGKEFDAWEIDGVKYDAGAYYTVMKATEVKALWKDIDDTPKPPAPTEFTVTFDGNGGKPDVPSMETSGGTLPFLPGATHSGQYRFDGWYTGRTDGESVTMATKFLKNTTVYAHWTYTGGSGSTVSFCTIEARAGANGSITPEGTVSVRAGSDQTFTITPDKGYMVSLLKIDGRRVAAARTYTFKNVRSAHTIEVEFARLRTFTDVPAGSYFEDAVNWAVEAGITTGAGASRFAPDGACTRAQAVTFLWRAAGSPEPETRVMPFTDVPAGSYYYDAVLWAVENGIANGTGGTTFSPDAVCTRAQIAAFLWRSEGTPAAGSANPFEDVSAGAYYAEAVLWAVQEGVTKGTGAARFSPDAHCTRAQIVTFLWRCKRG